MVDDSIATSFLREGHIAETARFQEETVTARFVRVTMRAKSGTMQPLLESRVEREALITQQFPCQPPLPNAQARGLSAPLLLHLLCFWNNYSGIRAQLHLSMACTVL